MSPALGLDLAAIARVCEAHGVARLRLFGSALTDRFDPEHSDVDLLVDFLPDARRTFSSLFALRDALEQVIGFPVDLVEARNLRNPYVARTVCPDARQLYAA